MAKAFSTTTYRKLRDAISSIYIASQQKAARALDQVLNEAHWQIGQRIVTVEQNNAIRAQYGERLLERLSKDLTKKHGNGFSETNLRYMRRFFIANPIQQRVAKLGWGKQCVLLSIEDDKLRKRYVKKAVKEEWTRDELIAALKKDKVKRKREKESPALVTAQPAAKKASARKKLSLHYVRGRLGIYRTVIFEGLHIKKKEYHLDLGFSVYRKDVDGIARRKHGTLVEVGGEASVRAARTASKKDLYTYKAYAERVVDGDTVWVKVCLGFGTYRRQKLRLRGINAPEVDDPRGKIAKGFLKRTLDSVDYIVIKTYGVEKFGRDLVDIFYLPGEDDVAKVADEGIYLNQELLDQGLVDLYLAQG